MELNLVAGGTVEVSDQTFGREFNEALIHQVVTAYLAGARQGTRAQKHARKSLGAVENRGVRRELVARERAPHALLSGVPVA